jgi:hypothetical protein
VETVGCSSLPAEGSQGSAPGKREKTIWSEAREETQSDSDKVFWAFAEADWAMMDEVDAPWQPRMNTMVVRVLRRRRASG